MTTENMSNEKSAEKVYVLCKYQQARVKNLRGHHGGHPSMWEFLSYLGASKLLAGRFFLDTPAFFIHLFDDLTLNPLFLSLGSLYVLQTTSIVLRNSVSTCNAFWALASNLPTYHCISFTYTYIKAPPMTLGSEINSAVETLQNIFAIPLGILHL